MCNKSWRINVSHLKDYIKRINNQMHTDNQNVFSADFTPTKRHRRHRMKMNKT